MTDKEIIIDGVNVSGCDFYDKNKKYCLTLKMNTRGFKNHSCFSGDFQKCIQDSKVCPYTFCKNNHNCYFKQLKRKERECAYWKKANDDKNKLLSKLGCPTTATARREVLVLQQQIDQLNEELKEQTGGLRPELKRLINKICRKYDIEAKTYHEKIVEIIHSLDDYNQALIDIEEILKQGIKIHDDIIVNKQILQKISEVVE